jgi:hypothetical protein
LVLGWAARKKRRGKRREVGYRVRRKKGPG